MMKLLSSWIKALCLSGFALALSLYGSTTFAAKCEYKVTNDWGSGFTATIRILNNGTAPIAGWAVKWNYSDGSRITNSWNATLTGANPYSAAPLNWNRNIARGASIEFGMQGINGGKKAQLPVVSGAVCTTVVTSSVAPVNSSAARSSSSLRSSSSVAVMRSSSSIASSLRSSSSAISRASSSVQIVLPVSSKSSSSLTSSSLRNSSSSAKTSSSASSVAPIVGGCSGYATRYWDCCKPHCGWSGNVPSLVAALPSCAANNTRLTNVNSGSSCDGGNAHMCWGMAPFTVNEKLAYGFAATSSGDVCGRCYQLQFTGSSYNSPGDPGSAALAGKTMIVQATNIGYDVKGGQFDILVPGGGVGAFNACSAQWGVSNSELGAQYGGLLAACKQEFGYKATLAQYKTCLINRCNSVFGSRGLTELQKACTWYADWFQAADNPALKYKEVSCPAELTARSGMNRGALNDIKTSCN